MRTLGHLAHPSFNSPPAVSGALPWATNVSLATRGITMNNTLTNQIHRDADPSITANQPEAKKFKMTKGAKKKYNLLVSMGVSPEQATVQVVEQMKKNKEIQQKRRLEKQQQKRLEKLRQKLQSKQNQSSKKQLERMKQNGDRSEPLPLERQPKKKAKKKKGNCDISENEAEGPRKEGSENLGPLNIGIMSANFPEELFTTKQLEVIKEMILNKIVDQGKKTEMKPKFHCSYNRPGWLMLSCADYNTLEWLKGEIDSIQPWQGTSLRIAGEAEMLLSEILTARIPESHNYSTEKILGLIEAQNEGLNATSWKVLSRVSIRVSEGPMELLTVYVDQQSAERLRGEKYTINYKFGRTVLSSKNFRITQGGSCSRVMEYKRILQ